MTAELKIYRVDKIDPPKFRERKGWLRSWDVLAASEAEALAEVPEWHQDGAKIIGVRPAVLPLIIGQWLRRP